MKVVLIPGPRNEELIAEMLEDQAACFHERLIYDEKYYYAGRMGGFDSGMYG